MLPSSRSVLAVMRVHGARLVAFLDPPSLARLLGPPLHDPTASARRCSRAQPRCPTDLDAPFPRMVLAARVDRGGDLGEHHDLTTTKGENRPSTFAAPQRAADIGLNCNPLTAGERVPRAFREGSAPRHPTVNLPPTALPRLPVCSLMQPPGGTFLQGHAATAFAA